MQRERSAKQGHAVRRTETVADGLERQLAARNGKAVTAVYGAVVVGIDRQCAAARNGEIVRAVKRGVRLLDLRQPVRVGDGRIGSAVRQRVLRPVGKIDEHTRQRLADEDGRAGRAANMRIVEDEAHRALHLAIDHNAAVAQQPRHVVHAGIGDGDGASRRHDSARAANAHIVAAEPNNGRAVGAWCLLPQRKLVGLHRLRHGRFGLHRAHTLQQPVRTKQRKQQHGKARDCDKRFLHLGNEPPFGRGARDICPAIWYDV